MLFILLKSEKIAQSVISALERTSWRNNRFQAHKCKLPRRTCTLFVVQKLGPPSHTGDPITPKHQKSYRKQTCRYLAKPVFDFLTAFNTCCSAYPQGSGIHKQLFSWSVWIQQFVLCISGQMFCKSVTMRYGALQRWCFWKIVLLRIWQQWLDVKPAACSKMLLLISCLHKKTYMSGSGKLLKSQHTLLLEKLFYLQHKKGWP